MIDNSQGGSTKQCSLLSSPPLMWKLACCSACVVHTVLHVGCHSPGGVLRVDCNSPGGVLVAADYSQLELRVIAHLSADRKLQSILNSGGDVFKMIASQWKMVDIADVTAEQRQHAKQVLLSIPFDTDSCIRGFGGDALCKSTS